MSDELPRDISIYVVGTGQDRGLNRLVTYLSNTYAVPITVVGYGVYELEAGRRVLIRSLRTNEQMTGQIAGTSKSGLTHTTEHVYERAKATGIFPALEAIDQVARRHSLYPKPFKGGIMYAPPQARNNVLVSVWGEPKANGLLRAYISTANFARFYRLSDEEVGHELGAVGDRLFSQDEARTFAAGLDGLLIKAQRPPEDDEISVGSTAE